jgi:heptosyltransferase-3
LFIQHGQAKEVAVLVLGGGAVGFFFGVEDLESEDGEAVDDEAGRLRVQRRDGVEVEALLFYLGKKHEVDLLGAVVAELVEAVDGVLDLGDGVIGGEWVAGLVFAVPEVEVGLVLVEHELGEGGVGPGCRRGRVVAVERGAVVQAEDAGGVKHGQRRNLPRIATPADKSKESARRTGELWSEEGRDATLERMNRESTTQARRVLIYRLGSLGDMLIALPALRLIARAYPDADRRMLTNVPVSVKAPAAAAILDGTGLVDGYFRYAVGARGVRELVALWWQLVRWRPDVLVYVAVARGVKAAKRDAMFFRLCGIGRQIGVPLTAAMQENLYGQSVPDASTEANLEPEGARLVRNLAELGDGRLEDPASWDLNLNADEKASADAAIGAAALRLPLLAVCVGTKVQVKDWGRENWRELLRRTAMKYPGHGLLLAGAPEEIEASEFAAEGWREGSGGLVVNLCGKLTPRESAAALARSKVFLGHDSGPMHLAAAVGTPCVAVFSGKNIPRHWWPFGPKHHVVYHRVECWGCNLEVCIAQRKRCITSIGVGEVMAAVEAAMSGMACVETAGRSD